MEHELPQRELVEQLAEQPVQSPQAQDELQVRLWHVPQPSLDVAPITQTGVPCSSQPSARSALQSE